MWSLMVMYVCTHTCGGYSHSNPGAAAGRACEERPWEASHSGWPLSANSLSPLCLAALGLFSCGVALWIIGPHL